MATSPLVSELPSEMTVPIALEMLLPAELSLVMDDEAKSVLEFLMTPEGLVVEMPRTNDYFRPVTSMEEFPPVEMVHPRMIAVAEMKDVEAEEDAGVEESPDVVVGSGRTSRGSRRDR